jgi:hypothetical protein
MASPRLYVYDVHLEVEEMTLADHLRQQIRETCTSSLLSALVPATLKEVKNQRPYVYAKTEFPAANVWTRSERVLDADDILGGGAMGAAQFRTVELMVEVRDSIDSDAAPGLPARLDSYALAIEQTMMTDPALLGLLYNLTLSASTHTIDREAHEKPVGLLELVWDATYRVDPTDPSTQA